MGSEYTQVRKQWRAVDTVADLERLWTRERFERSEDVERALRVLEMAIRVDGWPAVRERARPLLNEHRILHAQLVELAMRALEQDDADFFEAITQALRERSMGNYFRFWFAFFSTKHSARGETMFRRHLGTIDDAAVVKYRRWIRRIFRKLRFRCRSDRERALGHIAFAMYPEYRKGAYRSEAFDHWVECHAVASKVPKTLGGKPVTKAKHAELFAEAAAKVGEWSVVEGVRTSNGIPRTLAYLDAMARHMSDTELRRALRAFDGLLRTADHKKASQRVVDCAAYVGERLQRMDVSLDEWAKLLPYFAAPVLVRTCEGILEEKLDAATVELPGNPILVLPNTLDARAFRAALVASYLLFHRSDDGALYRVDGPMAVRATLPRSPLLPHGPGAIPSALRYPREPDSPHRMGFDLFRAYLPEAATRTTSTPASVPGMVWALRHHLHRRATVDGAARADDVPVLFFTETPDDELRAALEVHLGMFATCVLVRFDQPWHEPLLEGAVHVHAPTDPAALLACVGERVDVVAEAVGAFEARRASVDAALRPLRGVAAPHVQFERHA